MTARTYRHLAAMGSSFASGPGIHPMAEKSAMRSSRNYAHVLAERLGATAFHPNGAGMSAVADAVEKHLSDHPSD